MGLRVLGYGFGVRGRKVKSRDCALASDLVLVRLRAELRIYREEERGDGLEKGKWRRPTRDVAMRVPVLEIQAGRRLGFQQVNVQQANLMLEKTNHLKRNNFNYLHRLKSLTNPLGINQF